MVLKYSSVRIARGGYNRLGLIDFGLAWEACTVRIAVTMLGEKELFNQVTFLV